MMSSPNPNIQSFNVVLDALLDEQTPFPAHFLNRFSDIGPQDLRALMAIWSHVSPERRRRLMEDLEEVGDADTLLSFFDLAKAVIHDPEAQVRMLAIRLLWEDDDKSLVPTLLQMMETDEDIQVRATAANALGFFVYRGEVEEIPEDLLHTIEDHLLGVMASDQPSIVRIRAIESLGFSSRPEVIPLIMTAYKAETPDWMAAALYAMGRSANQRWKTQILERLDHPNHTVRYEAVRAAGELELTQSRDQLLDMARIDEDDEVRLAAIWSLSQIGGDEVRDLLDDLLEEAENDDDIALIEDAIENLSFTQDMRIFELFDIDVDDEDMDEDADSPSKDDSNSSKPKSQKKRGTED